MMRFYFKYIMISKYFAKKYKLKFNSRELSWPHKIFSNVFKPSLSKIVRTKKSLYKNENEKINLGMTIEHCTKKLIEILKSRKYNSKLIAQSYSLDSVECWLKNYFSKSIFTIKLLRN